MAKRRTEKGPPSDSDRRSPLIPKLLGLLLLSVFMFTVGVFVGRGTAPVQFDIPGLQTRLKMLRDEAFKEDVQRFRIDSETPGDQHPLKFREVLRSPVDPAENPPASAARTPQSAARRPAASSISARADQPEQVASRQSEDTARPYILQVASMKDGAAAAAMVDRLKLRGYPAYRESIEIPDKGLWYRVRVGEYNDLAVVEKVRSELGAMANDALVIRK